MFRPAGLQYESRPTPTQWHYDQHSSVRLYGQQKGEARRGVSRRVGEITTSLCRQVCVNASLTTLLQLSSKSLVPVNRVDFRAIGNFP
jgi:hypothetical protein